MKQCDYDTLLVMLGYASGAAFSKYDGMAYKILKFVNRLNGTNPNFTPYEIPEWFTGEE